METEIEYKQYRRFLVLNSLYKRSGGSITNSEILQELAFLIGIKNSNYEDVEQSLTDDGLIDKPGIGQYYHLTAKGKKAVEQIYSFPNERNEYFPSLTDMAITPK